MKLTSKKVKEYLPHDMWGGFKWIIPFVIPFIKKHNIKIKNHSWYQSGGGTCHYLIRDNDNYIYTFHADGEIVEKSYNTWGGGDWFENYLDEDSHNKSIKDFKYPFGLESESPNYYPKWFMELDFKNQEIKDGDRWWRFENINPKEYKKLEQGGC